MAASVTETTTNATTTAAPAPRTLPGIPDGGAGHPGTPPAQPTTIWNHLDFRRLWLAQSASLVGSQITALALPLTAVTLLDANSAQAGILAAAGSLPFLLCSLPAGVWVDRHRRRPLLIVSDLLSALLLLSIPLAAWLDALRMQHLYAVAFGIGVLTVLFEVAHYAYVPALVGRERVMEANSRLQVSHSAAESAGPGAAGLLAQALTAPVAIVVDACSFVVSAALLRRIRSVEPPPAQTTSGSIRRDVRDGMRALLGQPLLRPIVIGAVIHGIFHMAVVALFVLFATRTLEISPLLLGVIFAVGGLGSIPGALLSTPIARRVGVGPAIIGAWFFSAVTILVIPLAAGWYAVPLLAVGMLLSGMGSTVLNVQQWSLRQIITPDALQGRVTASHRFIVYGSHPIGALLGGALGSMLGLRTALACCAVAALLAPLVTLFSPLRHLRTLPTSPDDLPPGVTSIHDS